MLDIIASMKNRSSDIAIVGMSCRYPGANSVREVWENVLAGRRQFRRMPDVRLPLAEYHHPNAPDKTYGTKAAVLDGFEMDWAKRRIPKSAFDATDMVHWLALECAIEAAEDAGYNKESIVRANTGVLLGNTLTGEQSRTNSLRLRWPYAARAIREAGVRGGMSNESIEQLLLATEEIYKSVFPPVSEDTLAGAMSNTIAGRICNFFDLDGGGYTIDAACASSLIAVATAAEKLASGELDLAFAGGVDISLDPFELVGFAKAGALTRSDMTVYDRRASGFIPGEGCGFVILKRAEEAIASGEKIYALLRGWAVSSDGRGGITAPSAQGQTKAILRAYKKAGYSPRTLDFVEGHGTGTPVGDKAELEAIFAAISASDGELKSCGVSSFKSIVGHCKAAAGIGGFIKAVAGVNRRVVPPTAACKEANPFFQSTTPQLYPVLRGEQRDAASLMRAGVSAMGFGGINCHVTLESHGVPDERLAPAIAETALLASRQSSEVFLFSADNEEDMASLLETWAEEARLLSIAELTDLSMKLLADPLLSTRKHRAAVVAETPESLAELLKSAAKLENTADKKVWIGTADRKTRIGFLFPGQGSQQLEMARVLVDRYPWAAEMMRAFDALVPISHLIFRSVERATPEELAAWRKQLTQTENAQPAIVFASLLWRELFARLGVTAEVAGGHSLGELSAFAAAGALDLESLAKLSALRGTAMSAPEGEAGTMCSIQASRTEVERLLAGLEGYAVIANVNSSKQTVVSGEKPAIAALLASATAAGLRAQELPVSNAFHSRLVAGASEVIRTQADLDLLDTDPSISLCSGMGRTIEKGCDLLAHFAEQLVSEVDFVGLLGAMSSKADLFLELGPGRVLSGLAADAGLHCLPVESSPGADRDLNTAVAALFAAGMSLNLEVLREPRFARVYVSPKERKFFVSPTERPFKTTAARPISMGVGGALALELQLDAAVVDGYFQERAGFVADLIRADLKHRCAPVVNKVEVLEVAPQPTAPVQQASDDLLGVLVKLVADRTGYPPESIKGSARLLDDLNLDSIKAGELVATAAQIGGVAGLVDASAFANASLEDVANALRAAAPAGALTPVPKPAERSWVRNFCIESLAAPLGERTVPLSGGVVILASEQTRSLAAALQRKFGDRAVIRDFAETTPAIQVIACVDDSPESVRTAAVLSDQGALLAYVQRPGARSAISFAASVHLERPAQRVRTIEVDAAIDDLRTAELVLAELETAAPHTTAIYGADGVRREPRAALIDRHAQQTRKAVLQAGDVVLVTGGAKGVTAECALALAERTGVRLALAGASPAAGSKEIEATLARAETKKITARYYRCDVADREAVAKLIGAVRSELGEIAAVVHGAGINHPRLVQQVGLKDANAQLRPKLDGAENLMAALSDRPPRIFAALTSIIGVTGMPGNAWYAYANEALDRRLGAFAAKTGCEAVSIAYSVWSEIGMGAKMGATQKLEAMGTSSIPPEEGAGRFVELLLNDQGARQVIVAARLGGLDTWKRREAALVPKARFLENVLRFEPGVELVARATVRIDRDAAIRDHIYQGTSVMPAVLSLEAAAEATACLFGMSKLENVVIEQLELERAITVDPERGEEIEIRAETLEGPARRVKISVAAQQTAFKRPSVSAIFVLSDSTAPQEQVPAPAQVLDISAKEDLYGKLLFHGPAFHRLGELYTVTAKKLDFRARLDHPAATRDLGGAPALGDLFFRDTLLHAIQVSVPRDLCLPVRVDRWEIFDSSARPAGDLRVRATIEDAGPGEYTSVVTVTAEDGTLIERMSGALMRVMEHRASNPSTEELCDPAARDEREVDAAIRAACARAGIEAPRAIGLAHLPGIHGVERKERHERERPLLERVARGEVDWEPSGKPIAKNGEQLSLSHDDMSCIVVAGPAPQGVDLAPIERREAAQWIALLSERRRVLLEELTLHDGVDVAGTRIWAALEAARKAGVDDPILRTAVRVDSEVLFDAGSISVLTLPIVLLRGPKRIIAVVSARREAKPVLEPEVVNTAGLLEYGYDPNAYALDGSIEGKEAMPVLKLRFPILLKDAGNPSRTVYFSHYYSWTGQLREMSLYPVRNELARDLMSGQYGMVTNEVSLDVYGNAALNDVLEGNFWVGERSGPFGATVDLNFDWRRVNGDRSRERMARTKLRATWVKIVGEGMVEPAPIPGYLEKFIASRQPLSGAKTFEPEKLHEALAGMALGREMYRAPAGPGGAEPLIKRDFETELEESNAVGNIYFSSYGVWQGRVRDRFFYELLPQLARAAVKEGELTCLSARVQHLREAMPYEKVRVTMAVTAVHERAFDMYFEYQRVLPDGRTQKLAFAEQRAAWMQQREGKMVATPLPKTLLEAVLSRLKMRVERAV
jgi:enediyne polyketide synthase